MSTGSGDITAVLGCDTGDCSTLTVGDGDLLDFGANVDSATEGLFLPSHASDCSTATAEGQVCWQVDTQALYVNAALMNGAAPATERRSVYWGAGSLEVDGAQCGAPTAVLLHATGPKPLTIACNDSDSGTISGSTVMPDSWDGNAVTFELNIAKISATGGSYDMDFEAQCIGEDEAYLTFAGTGEAQAVVTMSTNDDRAQQSSAASPTINGTTCAGGDVLVWQGAIDAGASATSLQAIALIVGVKMEYVSTIGD